MILSNKYKEELDRIVMSEDMKKRILNNVLNKNIEAKGTIPTVYKPRNFKRNMQLAVACFTVVVCLSIAKSHPELFKPENRNIEQNQGISSNEENKVINNSKESDAYDNTDNTSDSNLDSTSDNTSDGKHKIIKSDIDSDNVDKKENPSQVEQKYKNSTDFQTNSGLETNINRESHSNEAVSTEKANEPAAISSAAQINEIKEEANKKSLEDSSKKESDNENKEKIMKRKSDEELDSGSMGMTSSIVSKEYKTIEEAETDAKLQIKPIEALPKGFNIDNISVISDSLIQIRYSNGKEYITFRAEKGSENISGDYNEYAIKETTKINGTDVNLNGNKNKLYNLATWEKDGISYSISSTNDIDEENIENMVKSNLNK